MNRDRTARRRRVRRRIVPDRGSVTVLFVGIIAAAVLLALALGALGRATHAQAHAQGVADLAALAAARELADSGGPACAVAQQVVAGHQAQLVTCQTEGLLVMLEVAVSTEPLPGWVTTARAGARAGPVGWDAQQDQ
ncbi:MAG TPA: Rv3654c family TadE-like protein [Beutenbergiaceae bacterium]|nr:Rv3654c family TadE-like protein [Beutenbergiaceae bacterium]